jgi:hypothetical protein
LLCEFREFPEGHWVLMLFDEKELSGQEPLEEGLEVEMIKCVEEDFDRVEGVVTARPV